VEVDTWLFGQSYIVVSASIVMLNKGANDDDRVVYPSIVPHPEFILKVL